MFIRIRSEQTADTAGVLKVIGIFGVSKGIPDVADDPEVLLRRKTDDLKRRGNDYLARKCAEGTFLQVEALAQLRRLVAEPGVNGAVERIL